MSVWCVGLCMCCVCGYGHVPLQRTTFTSGLPPSVSLSHTSSWFYFCFGLVCFSLLCVLPANWPWNFRAILPPCRRAETVEACYHIGSADQTLGLRLVLLASPYLLSISQSRIMLILWVKSSEVMPWCLMLKPASHIYKSTHLLRLSLLFRTKKTILL